MPRVFISYVRENSEDVTRLVNALKARRIEVWFDQTHLQPGDRWADVIRREISQGDFFIACFSTEFSKRRKTFMNEEITQAIEQLRQRPTDQNWFIPVLLSDCRIPDRSIGAGETLHSIQRVALYNDWDEGIRRIVEVIQSEPEGEPLDRHQQNAYFEQNIVHSMQWSMNDMVESDQSERRVEKFSLVQDDLSMHEYTRQEVDKLTPTQRERLFTADPEMTAWWRGKSPTSGSWPLFRVRGGIWIAKHQIEQTPQEHRSAIWEIPGLLDWYMEGLEF
jgi:TIR domain